MDSLIETPHYPLAVAYEVQCRFTAAVSVIPKGFNHSTQLAMSIAAAF
jgi:2-methylcitrate dehydratase